MMNENIQSVDQTQPEQQLEETPKSKETDFGMIKKRKILIISIFIAVVVALLVYFLVNKFLPTQEVKPAPLTLPKATLILENPKDQEAVTTAQITVDGKTNPNSFVAVYTETQDEIFESDENGNFSGTFTLDPGPNELTFTAFGQENEEKIEIRSVVYLTEDEL